MGRPIAIDTSILIYLIEDHPEFADLVELILEPIRNGRQEGIFASVGLIELLTGPKLKGRYDLAEEYRQSVINFPNLTIIDLSFEIIDLASSLRAKYNLTTPDAIHLATAINNGARVFVTNDKALRKVKEIKVRTLN